MSSKKDDQNRDGKCEFCRKEYKIDRSKGHRKSRCGSCRDKLTSIRNKIRILEELEDKCEICGYDSCISGLDYHHTNQEDKEAEVSSLLSSRSYEKALEEAEKCDLLCANCHTEHHENERDSCSCGECKACWQRNTRKERKWRAIEEKGGLCENCGIEIDSLGIATFHHRNPDDKELKLSGNNFARSWESINEELKKCDLLCNNCHNAVHCTGSDFCNHKHGRFSEVGLPENK